MNIQDLALVPDIKRDVKWEDQFLKSLTESKINVLSPDPQVGPDNWPYIMAETNVSATEPAQKVLQWLATRGIGLVVNPMKAQPDYIITYGMIWSFRETGYFVRRDLQIDNGNFDVSKDKILHAGAPTEQYLPGYVRQILRDFFRDQGVYEAKLLVLSFDNKNYELAISLDSIGNPPEQEWNGIAEAVSWFLPPHYSILLVQEKGLPPFQPL